MEELEKLKIRIKELEAERESLLIGWTKAFNSSMKAKKELKAFIKKYKKSKEQIKELNSIINKLNNNEVDQ